MSNNTKERILEAALKIFSRDGYAGANLKDIAEAVGVVKSGFYRHYASKEELWDAVLDEMERYYAERFGSTENLPAIPQSTDELKTLTLRMLDFTMHDEKIIMIRKILLNEQFRDARVRALATKHFVTGLEALFMKLFAGMMENGSIKRGDPAMLAFTYTAPISTLVQLCDREPEKEPEIMRQIEAYVKHFIKIYGIKRNDDRQRNEMRIIRFENRYRDDMIFMVLQAKDALGRIPTINSDLLDIKTSYFGKGDIFWLAIDENDRVTGCVGCSRIPGTAEAFLHRLYVKPTLKRTGIGTALLGMAEQWMRKNGITVSKVHLGEPKEQWFESYAFYPKNGYAEYEPRYMKKEL